MIASRKDISAARRVLIKIGSSLLTDADSGIRLSVVEGLAKQIAAMHAQGIQVCLVTSGSVSLGRVQMGWIGKHLSVHEKQAAAAMGQPSLMHAYKHAFSEVGLQVAQMLLTKDDLRHRRRYLNARNTSETLFEAGVIPIVNENDTVVVEEIKFGDNDTLGALVSLVVDADLMIMMTDVDGLFDKNPAHDAQATRLSVVEHITAEITAMAGDASSEFGTGGMMSKLKAAKIASKSGVAVAIINGQESNALPDFLAGKDMGTLFLCAEDRQSHRMHWIADLLHSEGQIYVDAGAARAIVEDGGSLLSVGMVKVEGAFDKGECVEIVGSDGVIARGLSNYNAEDTTRLIGINSDQIEAILGYVDFTSMVHRDNLVLTDHGQGK